MKITDIFEANTKTEEKPTTKYDLQLAIQKYIKDNAMDPTQHYLSTLELVKQAYDAVGIDQPTILTPEWDKYNQNIQYAVKMLQLATDREIRDDSWKLTTTES